jgi:hypothetical protein
MRAHSPAASHLGGAHRRDPPYSSDRAPHSPIARARGGRILVRRGGVRRLPVRRHPCPDTCDDCRSTIVLSEVLCEMGLQRHSSYFPAVGEGGAKRREKSACEEKVTNKELVDRVYKVNEKTPTKEIENLILIVHNRIKADDKPPKGYDTWWYFLSHIGRRWKGSDT